MMDIEDEIKGEIRRMEKKAGCKAETWSINHFPIFYTWYKAFCWVQSRLRGEEAMEKADEKAIPRKDFRFSDDHIQRHNELHKALDELTADYIRITGKLPGATNILELMEWSNKQRTNPEIKEVSR